LLVVRDRLEKLAEGKLAYLGVGFMSYRAVLSLALFATASFSLNLPNAKAQYVSFHDLGGDPSPGNITTQPDLITTIDLIRFTDGVDTGINFSVAGANGIFSSAGGIAPPAAGTPAGALFLGSGMDLDDGGVNEGGNGGSGATTFTFGGLDPARLYDIAIYGDRNASLDGVERFTLRGADGAINTSSLYKISSVAADINTRPNASTGDVARWSSIRPGADGIVTVDIDPEVTSPSNIAYLTGLRLEDTGIATPQTSLTEFTAYHDFGVEASPGNITTQTSLNTTYTFIDFATGQDTAVDFSIAGANDVVGTSAGAVLPPASGTPADSLFSSSGINLGEGTMVEGGNNGSGATTLTFDGLNPDWRYDVALYGDRDANSDGIERFTLIGADEATNSSSSGIISDFITDLETRPNSTTGDVVRWTEVAPGMDGVFFIEIDPEVSSASNIAYISAVRFAGAAPAAVPEPSTIALWSLLGVGLGSYRRWRSR
jgi:hypothetical protein